jgi:hypothetical protein
MTRRRRLVAIALAVCVCLGAVLSRVFWDGTSALSDGDVAHARAEQARTAGDATGAREAEEEAITRWRRAARWYAPGAPHVDKAYARLAALAQAAEKAGERELALSAWRAVRSSSLATRSFYVPHEADLHGANAQIARLMAALEDPSVDPARDQAGRQAWHLALLERDEAPSVGFSILAILGFFTWVGGGFWFAWRGLTAEDKLDRRQASVAGVLVVIGLAVWMVSLYKA